MKLEQREYNFTASDFAMQGKVAIELKEVEAHPVSAIIMNSDGLVIKDAEFLITKKFVVIKLPNTARMEFKELVFKPEFKNYKVVITLPDILDK